MPLRSCGASVVRSCGHLCSSVPEPVRGQCRRARTRKLTPWELGYWQGCSEVRVRGMSHLPQQPSNQQKKAVIGSRLRELCDWLQSTDLGPVPGAGPSLRGAHVDQVVEVGGRRDELGAHKRVLQHLPGGRAGVEAGRASEPHPAPRAESPTLQPQPPHGPAPALLLALLIRHPEEEAALALGAEQLAPAVVREVGNVKLVLLCGKSGSRGGSHVSQPAAAGAQAHTCHRRAHTAVGRRTFPHLPMDS